MIKHSKISIVLFNFIALQTLYMHAGELTQRRADQIVTSRRVAYFVHTINRDTHPRHTSYAGPFDNESRRPYRNSAPNQSPQHCTHQQESMPPQYPRQESALQAHAVPIHPHMPSHTAPISFDPEENTKLKKQLNAEQNNTKALRAQIAFLTQQHSKSKWKNNDQRCAHEISRLRWHVQTLTAKVAYVHNVALQFRTACDGLQQNLNNVTAAHIEAVNQSNLLRIDAERAKKDAERAKNRCKQKHHRRKKRKRHSDSDSDSDNPSKRHRPNADEHST